MHRLGGVYLQATPLTQKQEAECVIEFRVGKQYRR
jgi:hypothetical protein